MEMADFYVIQPDFPWWDKSNWKMAKLATTDFNTAATRTPDG